MRAEDLIQKCTMNRVVNIVKYKSDFNSVDQQIRDSLRVLASAPQVNEAPSVNRALQDYTVDAYDDDSDEDFGALVPVALGGAMAPAGRMPFGSPQPTVVCESVLLMEDGNMILAERVSVSQSNMWRNF